MGMMGGQEKTCVNFLRNEWHLFGHYDSSTEDKMSRFLWVEKSFPETFKKVIWVFFNMMFKAEMWRILCRWFRIFQIVLSPPYPLFVAYLQESWNSYYSVWLHWKEQLKIHCLEFFSKHLSLDRIILPEILSLTHRKLNTQEEILQVILCTT